MVSCKFSHHPILWNMISSNRLCQKLTGRATKRFVYNRRFVSACVLVIHELSQELPLLEVEVRFYRTFVSAIGTNWNQLEPIGTNWNHCGTTCSVLISEKRWNMLEHIVGQIGLSLATAEVVKSGPKRGPNSNAGKWGWTKTKHEVERKLNRLSRWDRMWPGKPVILFVWNCAHISLYILLHIKLFNIIEIIFFYWSNADQILSYGSMVGLPDHSFARRCHNGVMDSAAPKNRGAEGSTAAVHCCSPAYHVCIAFASALAEITAVLRQNGQVVFFGSAALDRARSQHRHILKIPWFINWDCIWCIFITCTNEWLKEAWHRALQCSEAEKYYPIYWVLAFTMGIHIDTAQIEFEFPSISDRSFLWRVEKQCSHPYAAWRCLWMVCSRWMRPRMSFVATGVLISSSSLYVYMYYILYSIIQYDITIYLYTYMFLCLIYWPILFRED